MSDVLILHNPRCSKSCAALALLRERGVEPRIIDYLRNPPDAEQLAHWIELLGVSVREALRHDEADYTRLGLDDPALSDADLIAAAIAHPHLIQRPLVVAGERAAIGRPPEAVLRLL